MRVEEAQKISSHLRDFNQLDMTSCRILNIGSSTKEFREIHQPHIQSMLIEPCEEVGFSFFHHDIKEGNGIHVHGDLLDASVLKKLIEVNADIVMACNILEHIPQDRFDDFVSALDQIVRPGACLAISVPHSYPLHLDPIDSYFRPSPDELALMFPSYETLVSEVIVSSTYAREFFNLPFRDKLKTFIRVCMPFYEFHTWKCVAHRFAWWLSPFKVAFVLLQKKVA